MKQFLRSFLTLLMLVVWASGFAADKTYSYTFKFGDFSATKKTNTLNGVNWTLAVESWYGSESYAWDNGKGLKIGSSNSKYPKGNVTITTTEIVGTIKKVTVNTSSNASSTTTLKVLVGDTQIGKQQSLTSTATNFTFEGSATGDIVLSYADSNKPIFIKSISVIYEKGPEKTPTTLTFDDPTISIEEGNETSFTGQTATLKTGETVLNNAITYTTNNDAMFEAYDTKVGPKTLKTGAYGTATVTAKFNGDDTYEASTATYTVKYTEKEKPTTTLDFGFATKTVNIDETFTAAATLKSGETAIKGAVTYSSYKPEVAYVDEATGEVTALTAGKTTITATFAGTSEYKSSTATYELTVVDPNAPLENIVFDATTKGFDDIKLSKQYPETEETATFKAENGNTYNFTYSNCMRYNNSNANSNVIQMKKTSGSFTSPVFDEMPNGYKVNVYYGINDNNTPLTITSNEETSATSISNAYGDKNKTNGTGYRTSIILANGSSFTVQAGGSACYVSKIEILPISAPITLEEDATDTDTKIANNKGKTQDVTLTRTLVANKWNTLCVPFETEIAGTALEGATVKAVGEVVGNVINLVDATKIEAGVPYLVMPTTGDIVNPTFKSVTITEISAKEAGNTDYKFVGTYSPKTITVDEFGKIWGVTAEGKLAKINANTTMKGLRAYFVFPVNVAAKLNFDGETTGINNIETEATVNGKVYNLNGQYVGNSLNGLKKGIYVVNGKKVIK